MSDAFWEGFWAMIDQMWWLVALALLFPPQ
jgi:hypothetical protein